MYGIEESDHENMDDPVLNTLNAELNLDLTINDFHRSHWIGKAQVKGENRKSTPIIVRFVRYLVRKNIFKHNKIKK